MVLHPRPKSKRQTSRHRAKVTRKVREHDRKQRKEAKANPKRGKKQRDPGIPSSFPRKEAFLEQLAADRESEKIHHKKQKSEAEKLQEMLKDVENRGKVYAMLGKDNPSESKVIKAVPDSSKKAYFREFNQVVESSDVVLEVLDARDPQGCRVESVEAAVREAGKKLVLVLNKTDLVPIQVVRAWLVHLRRSFPTVAFKSSINSQRSGLGADGGLTANDAVGADQLVSLLKNYSRSHELKTVITVGVVGYPNVGKSSLINSLKRSKVCQVGAAPGVTTTSQRIHLDRNVSLLDCPGIVFSANEDSVYLRNVLKVEQLQDPIAPIGAILRRVQREQLLAVFGCSWTGGLEVGDPDDVSAFLRAVALSHGRLKKGGVPDLESAARFVLNEWNSGKIKYWTEPPSLDQSNSADTCEIVNQLSPEFVFESACADNQGISADTMEIDS